MAERMSGNNSEFSLWMDASSVPEISPQAELYSSGFLKADVTKLTSGLAEQWMPFFATVGLEVADFNCSVGLDFPQQMTRLTPFTINGETALLGIDRHSVDGLLADFISGVSAETAEPVLAYLERRLLASFEKSWKGPKKIKVSTLTSGWSGEIAVVGNIRVTFTANGYPVIFWIGLGEESLALIDSHWKSQIGNPLKLEGDQSLVTVTLADLSIAPAVLIDYLRIGKEFRVDNAIWPKVTVSLNNSPWAEGELVRFGGDLGVRILGFSLKASEVVPGTTRICVRISEEEIANSTLNCSAQVGAVLQLNESRLPKVRLVVSGEEVGTAQLGTCGKDLGVKVLGS